ncbi:MAG: hypothetical protein REH79_03535 [Spiroplasma sp.]|nr:hypothetical protein [Spiroplasma sp.]
MKKYLLILSSITAVGVGATANIINQPKSNINTNTSAIKESLDLSKYDVSDGSTTSFQLDNLLKIIKEINQEHKDNNQQLTFVTIPRWNLISDAGDIFAVGWMFLAKEQLEILINSDNIQFDRVLMTISGSEKIIKVSLNYQLANIDNTLELIQVQQENIPLKQEKLWTGVEMIYN